MENIILNNHRNTENQLKNWKTQKIIHKKKEKKHSETIEYNLAIVTKYIGDMEKGLNVSN